MAAISRERTDRELDGSLMSPFNDWLKTNHVPDELERARITKLLSHPQCTISGVKHNISSLRQALDKATERKGMIQAKIHQHLALLSPFRMLSNEVLSTIFLYCLPETHNAVMDSAQPPLVLGCVCRRWRFVAFNSPTLWTSLHIPFPAYAPHYDVSPQLQLQRFKARMSLHQAAIHQWLMRSGSLHLALSLQIPLLDSYYAIFAGDYRGYLILLISIFPRLYSLEATIPPGDFSAFFASITPTEVPALTRLQLAFSSRNPIWNRGFNSGPDYGNDWYYSSLLRVKSLRDIRLTEFPGIHIHIGMKLTNLTSLNILHSRGNQEYRAFTLREAHYILTRCHKLVHLGMDVVDVPGAVSPSGRIALPLLESITLFDAAYWLVTLIDRLDVPSLKIVRYHSKFSPAIPRGRSPLITLLSKNQSKTEKITTNIGYLTLNDTLWLFYYTPNLTSFCHETWVFPEQAVYSTWCYIPLNFLRAFFEFLIPDEQGRGPFPNLRYLYMKDAQPEIIDQHLIARFIKKRRERGDKSTAYALSHIRIEAAGYGSSSCEPGAFVHHVRYTQEDLYQGDELDELEGVDVELFYPTTSRAANKYLLKKGRFERGGGVHSSRQWSWRLHPYPMK